MRAKREEAELATRVTAQMAGLPTSLAAFKGHPLYVLARHVGKYQVRRGAALLLAGVGGRVGGWSCVWGGSRGRLAGCCG